MHRLLIADASEVFTDALAEVFQNDFDLQICHDGETALDALLSFQPEILVLNLMLPYKDGLTVLQESAHRPKIILATSPYTNPYIEHISISLGIQFLMIMPTVSALRVRLMDLISTTLAPKADLVCQTVMHLHVLNFLTHLDGYRQLRAGIPIFAANPTLRMSKELYPAIAQQLDIPDARSVEHSIRKAITATWRRRNPTVWAKYFPPEADGGIPCPTNKAFISRLAEMLEL